MPQIDSNKPPIRLYKEEVRPRRKIPMGFIFLSFAFLFAGALTFEFLRFHRSDEVSGTATRLSIKTLKKNHMRFELVKIEASFLNQKGKPIEDARLYGEVYNPKGEVVYTVGYKDRFHFVYDKSKNVYAAQWVPPFNPVLGKYRLKVFTSYVFKVRKTLGGWKPKTVGIPGLPFIRIPYPEKPPKQVKKPTVVHEKEKRDFSASTFFILKGRPVPRFSPKVRAVDLETAGNILGVRVRGPDQKVGDWKNIIRWAKFMGANTFFTLVGQTANWGSRVEMEGSWVKSNLDSFPELARETHWQGLKFGGWIAAYLTFGTGKPFPDYQYAMNYSSKLGTCVPTRSISLLDERRIRDMADLARRLDADPNVDFIGLDYIRTAAGGYEMVDEFVRDMNPTKPKQFFKWSIAKRMAWLGREVATRKDLSLSGVDLYEQWNWWRAHKTAEIVRRVIKESGSKKPFWVFTLGWKHGIQHGQDPLMMNDVGVFASAVMLYEIEKKLFKYLLTDWKGYLQPGQVNLMPGNTVDWPLHQKTLNPPGPQEFFNRLTEGYRNISGGAPSAGVFWHDLGRGLWGRRGPYSLLEWAVAGMATFSIVQQDWNEVPLRIRLEFPESLQKVNFHRAFPVTVQVENRGKEPLRNIRLRLFKTPGLQIVKPQARIAEVLPDSGQAVDLSARIIKPMGDRANYYMVAVSAVWDGSPTENGLVDFRYVRGIR